MTTLNTYEAATALKAELGAVVDETAIIVDLDPATVNSALTAGRSAICIRPPKVSYPTTFSAEAEWSLILITPNTDLVRAWSELDAMLATVAEAVDVDTAAPSSYQTAKGTTYPAFLVEFTQPYNL